MTAFASQPAVPARRCSPSWVEVEGAAVRHNVCVLRNLVAPSQVLAVVKANAYGHGAVEVARAALEGGAAGLAVACLPEGIQLREAGFTGLLLLLNAGDPSDAPEVVAYDLTQTLCQLEMAQALSTAALTAGRPASVHFKFDTGMGRLGVLPEQVTHFVQTVGALPGISITGAFSHLATSEDPDAGYAHWQLARFHTCLAALSSYGITPAFRHLANSAATLRFPEMRFDAVRTGLLVYGLDPMPNQQVLPLRPALSWKTHLALVRRVPAGSSISYARTYTTSTERLLGVLPLGYADGFPRTASNRAHVLVRGQRCPTVGTVCMDHVVVDVTPATAPSPAGEVRTGEEVVLIGEQQGKRITVNQLAEWAGTVVHEIPTRLGPRVNRIFLSDQVSYQVESAKRSGPSGRKRGEPS